MSRRPIEKTRCPQMSAFARLCISHGLSCFGDRLWAFGFGLFLIRLGGNIRLVAINQLANGIAVLLGAAAVGRWIDQKPRLTAAQTMLTVNNLSVAVSALLAGWLLIRDVHPNVFNLVISISILFCTVSMLASTGQKIVITKDWVVIISQGNKDLLAARNAMLLRIDLTLNIVAPIIAGQLMTSLNMLAGCMLMIGWNLLSWPVEFTLLRQIYAAYPELEKKKKKAELNEKEREMVDIAEKQLIVSAEEPLIIPAIGSQPERRQIPVPNPGFICRLVQPICDFLNSFVIYRRQSVFPAAFALALLYMTVLGFDSITTGFAYSQGLVEVVLAGARGTGALVGISGTLVFPYLRQRVGIIRTGLLALTLELGFLLLAIASIWLPGSPFDPVGYVREFSMTDQDSNFTINLNETVTAEKLTDNRRSFISIIVLLAGIVFARFGLWLADLSITQVMQENVAETERGAVFGTQAAVNKLFGMFKDGLVILLPDPRIFGLLIIMSVLAVATGLFSFCIYAINVKKPVPAQLAKETLKENEKDIVQPIV